MARTSEREKIMKLLRDSLIDNDGQLSVAEKGEEMFTPTLEDPVMIFAENLAKGDGKFIYCASEDEFFNSFKKIIDLRKWHNIGSFSNNLRTYLHSKGIDTSIADKNSEVAISLCQGIVAKTGSIVITSIQGIGNTLTKFPPILIVIAMASQVYNSYKQVLSLLPETPPQWVVSIRSGQLISEEVKEFYLFLIED